MDTAAPESVELRCTAGFGKLLGKLRTSGLPLTIDADNLAELPCPDCRRERRLAGEPVRMVLHRFNFVGELVESLVVWTDGSSYVVSEAQA